MKNSFESLTESELIKLLNVAYQAPVRDQATAAHSRTSFLNEAQDLRNATALPVSISFLSSLKVWIKSLYPAGQTRKDKMMFAMRFSTVVLVLSMIFGGAANAVQAAEASLPGQAMYQLKIMVEDVRGMAAGPVGRVEQSVQRVESRIQEILQLHEQGKAVPEAAFVRLEKQLEQTLRLMLRLTDEELDLELVQVRSRLMAQEQILRQLQSQEQGTGDAVLERIRTMLQERLQVIGDETKDPQQLKLEIQDRDRDRDSWEGQENPPANGEGNGAGPGYQNQEGAGSPGQNGTGTGTGAGAGPGPGAGEPCATCTPVQDGTGPGPGPGDCESSPTCTPVEDGTGPGPGPGAGEVTPSGTPVQDGTGPGPGPGAGATTTPPGSGSGSKP